MGRSQRSTSVGSSPMMSTSVGSSPPRSPSVGSSPLRSLSVGSSPLRPLGLRSLLLLLLVVSAPWWPGGQSCPIDGPVPDVWVEAADRGVPDYFYEYGEGVDTVLRDENSFGNSVLVNISNFNLFSTIIKNVTVRIKGFTHQYWS